MKMYTISKAEAWTEILNLFTQEVNCGKYHKLAYDIYRKIAKYKPSAGINIYDRDDDYIYVEDSAKHNVGGNAYCLFRGLKTDNSFGSFLYDKYFKENEKMIDNTKSGQAYDLWGSYLNCTSETTSFTETVHNLVDSYGLATCNVDGSWEINGNDWNSSSSTNKSVNSYCSYPTPEEFKTLQKRVEELGKLCTDIQVSLNRVEDGVRYDIDKIVDELVATNEMKADASDVCSLSKRINDVLSVADEASYDVNQVLRDMEDNAADINALGDEVWNLRQQMEELQKAMEGVIIVSPDATKMQSTSSNVYPVKNYNINLKADCADGDNGKDKENMDTNKMFTGFDFGPVDERVKMSPYGMAIRNADGRYVSYDAKTGQIIDVEVFNFDNHNMIFKMPVAVSAIAVGDTVIHMKKPMFVTSVTNGVSVIDIFNGEIKTIMPTTNMFGFNFITKVVSLFNFTGANAPTAENPFGNILPFMMMNGDFNGDTSDMFMMMAMSNNMNMGNMMQNPLMMYCLMGKDSEMKHYLPFMMMSDMMQKTISTTYGCNNAETHTQCNCNNHN